MAAVLRVVAGGVVALAIGAAAGPGCDPAAGRPTTRDGGATRTQVAPTLPDSVFAALVADLSEPGQFFDTDNLISNEASYLHVVDALEERGLRGGAYLGVGPGQNFSYLAVLRPRLAFLVDIRRDNLLQHLWYKALFEAADSRLDYLCLMVARRCGGPSDGLDVVELVQRVDDAPPVAAVDRLIDETVVAVAGFGVTLTPEDRETVRSIHARFASAGLDLRFNTHGRAPLPGYPTLRRLIAERDGRGGHASYLAREDEYRFVRDLERAHRVVPVTGDLAGDHAIRAIAAEVRRRDLEVTAFYTSNVEYYLFGDGSYPRFIANLRALPADDDAVIIRSYFNRFRRLPESRPGYTSTQLLEPIPALLDRWDAGGVRSYPELIGF